MAELAPLRALRYDPARAGVLQDLAAPPYDVVDPAGRAALAARSPYNAVHLDLPEGEDPYAAAAATLRRWRDEGVLVQDDEPALWALEQGYRGPDGRDRTRRGVLGRVRIEPYGAGRIRPHERTHRGPKEDRLRLMRATGANLSPVFALYSDAAGAAAAALAAHTSSPPWAELVDDDATRHRLWRVADPAAMEPLIAAVRPAELLIADGHHRYETARAYADEVGGEGEHRWALMCLVALEDPGLTVFPTHRLVRGLRPDQQEALADAIRRDWEIEPVAEHELVPPPDGERVRIGYMDSHFERPFRLTLRDPARAAAALPGHAPAYRALDTAVTEALLLKAALGYTDERIDRLDGFGYARDLETGRRLLHEAAYDAGFFMGATPVPRIRAVASAGESMPPKSTYFFPKVPTGLVFQPLA